MEKVENLTNEELVFKIQAGEWDLIAQLWKQVERFVKTRARRWVRAARGVDFDDFMQTGFIAVVDAANRFEDGNAKFLTYLDFYLKKHFQRACAAASGWSMGTYSHKAELGLSVSSLNQNIDPDGDTELGDMIPNPRNYIEELESGIYGEQLRMELQTAMEKLPDDERAVLYQRYINGSTMEEACEVLGLSKGQLDLRQRHGLRKLRKNRVLRKYFEAEKE